MKEPSGLCRSDRKQPDGLTLILWHACMHVCMYACMYALLAVTTGTRLRFDCCATPARFPCDYATSCVEWE